MRDHHVVPHVDINGRARAVLLGGLLISCVAGSATGVLAQTRGGRIGPHGDSVAPSALVESTVVVPGPEYRAGFMRRWLMGENNRGAWTTRLSVPVLHIDSFAGGLEPVGLGGGMETISLHLKGRDGREYRFRSVDKEPSRELPEELRTETVENVYRDIVSFEYPGGSVLVAPLLSAAGVLHVTPQLFVMGDDSALGKYRAQFRGMLGDLEERPRTEDGWALFEGSTRIVSTKKMLEEVDRGASDRQDAAAYLAARLMDVFVGDWDRGSKQWLWARYEARRGRIWRPIPRDRDDAFTRSNGLLPWIARGWYPQLLEFGDDYPDMLGLVKNSWWLDRRLLQELDRTAWDSTIAALQHNLSDSAIDAALRQLPAALCATDCPRLAQTLRRRRDALPKPAAQFYDMVSREADVHAADAPSTVEITRESDGAVDLRLSVQGGRAHSVYYRRRFVPRETSEIRLYLGRGPDSVITSGRAAGITVRIVTGERAAVVIDSVRSATGSGRIVIYDSTGRSAVWPAGVPVDRRAYTPPAPMGMDQFVRDDGDSVLVSPWLDANSDIGVLGGASLTFERRGFRRIPFAQYHTLSAGYATPVNGFKAEYDGTFRATSSSTLWSIHAAASELDLLRYFGIGNETSRSAPDDFYRIRNGGYQAYTASFGLVAPLTALTDRATVSFDPFVRYSRTLSGKATLLSQTRPYGSGNFGVVGVRGRARLGAGDADAADPQRGFALDLGGSASPAWWDAAKGGAYGQVHGEARTYLTAGAIPTSPTLALRAGAQKGWGDTPFEDLAYLGGPQSPLRGFHSNRFAGESMTFGNAELRGRLRDMVVVVPVRVGAFALADVGRVYAVGESSTKWHNDAGGGLWLGLLKDLFVVRVAAVHSIEGTILDLRSGFAY